MATNTNINTDGDTDDIETNTENNSSLLSAQKENETKPVSKNQLKKQRKKEKWLEIKQERRRHTKENRKRRLAELREKGEDIGPTRKKLKTNTMKNSLCKIKVVLDLSWDTHMAEKDVNSLTCQIQHSYSANRRAKNPLQLYLCSLGGKTKQRLDTIGDYKGWDIYTETRSYEEVFPKENLVYLSSESPNVLTSLSEDNVYIIGGLVDHNKLKGLCHKTAEEKGIAHAQLPIAEFLDMKTRRVLAVNHVFSILLRFTETGDWKEAFLAEMPQRKQAQAKSKNTDTAGTVKATSSETSNADDASTSNKTDDCLSNNVDSKQDSSNNQSHCDPPPSAVTDEGSEDNSDNSCTDGLAASSSEERHIGNNDTEYCGNNNTNQAGNNETERSCDNNTYHSCNSKTEQILAEEKDNSGNRATVSVVEENDRS